MVPAALRDYEFLTGSTLRGGVAVGAFLLLLMAGFAWVAFGDLPRGVEAPKLSPAVFTAFGACLFGAPGLFVLSMGLGDLRRNARVREGRRRQPAEPWRWDYTWPDRDAPDVGLAQACKGAVGCLVGIGIVVPINYVTLFEADPPFAYFAQFGVGFFDLLLLLSLGTVLHRIAAQIRHRGVTLRLQETPLRLDRRAHLTLLPHPVLADVEALDCTLRCVEEVCEARRHGRVGPEVSPGTTVTKAALEHYAEQRRIELRGGAGSGATLRFDLPEDAQLRTRLTDAPSLHWELMVEARRPGLDLAKRFLLPIY